MSFLTGFRASGVDLRTYLSTRGAILTTFDDQDSGCESYGVEIDGSRWFVKHGAPGSPAGSLERSLAFHRVVSHPAIIRPAAAITTDRGVTLC